MTVSRTERRVVIRVLLRVVSVFQNFHFFKNFIFQNTILLIVILLNDISQNFILLEFYAAACHFTKCHTAECRGALEVSYLKLLLKINFFGRNKQLFDTW
jgi:hypothetical protein